jgi:multisubunit Na+/H+ antiporter MnhB subunit
MCHAPLPHAPLPHAPRSTVSTPTTTSSRPLANLGREKVFVATRAPTPKPQKPRFEGLSDDMPTRIAMLIGLNAALGIVGIGLWRRAPGLAVLYVLVVAPAVTAMYVSFDRQRHSDSLGRVGDFIDGVLSVLARTFAILCLLVLAIFSALFLFCSFALLSIVVRH